MTVAYIGLGSNLKNPCMQIANAFMALEELPATVVVRRSSLYFSKPVGPRNQPDYINAVAKLETSLSPYKLLESMQAIEANQDRSRAVARWGPRTLDLDLLVFGQEFIHDSRLIVPHPEIAKRNFVLSPLVEISPDLNIPGSGPVTRLLDEIGTAGLEKIAD